MSAADHTHKKTKPISCTVTSDCMDKSRVGVVERLVKHRQYEKYIRRSTKIMFHDEKNEAKVGDKVLIAPSRPHSARKRFSLVKILESTSQG